jgi:hypothetical protein
MFHSGNLLITFLCTESTPRISSGCEKLWSMATHVTLSFSQTFSSTHFSASLVRVVDPWCHGHDGELDRQIPAKGRRAATLFLPLHPSLYPPPSQKVRVWDLRQDEVEDLDPNEARLTNIVGLAVKNRDPAMAFSTVRCRVSAPMTSSSSCDIMDKQQCCKGLKTMLCC